MRLINADELKQLRDDYISGKIQFDGSECDLIDRCPTINAVVMPCSVGDRVYRIDKHGNWPDYKPFIQELTVTEISWKTEKYGDKDLGFAIIANGIRYKFTSIGKSVFLTREDAEAKLREVSPDDFCSFGEREVK